MRTGYRSELIREVADLDSIPEGFHFDYQKAWITLEKELRKKDKNARLTNNLIRLYHSIYCKVAVLVAVITLLTMPVAENVSTQQKNLTGQPVTRSSDKTMPGTSLTAVYAPDSAKKHFHKQPAKRKTTDAIRIPIAIMADTAAHTIDSFYAGFPPGPVVTSRDTAITTAKKEQKVFRVEHINDLRDRGDSWKLPPPAKEASRKKRSNRYFSSG